ncbi:MAG: DUF3237 family protein [Dehalococcoidia bacterium]
MRLAPLCEMELRYTRLEILDYGAGGQIFGAMEGTVSGERLHGAMDLVNLAPRRPDNVNLPTLRGLLTTDDGAKLYIEIDGMATLRPSDEARVVVHSMTFRTGDPRYAWLNRVFAVAEGVLDRVAVGGVFRARAYACEATIGMAGEAGAAEVRV